jgi:transaldolase
LRGSRIKLFADGANLEEMLAAYRSGAVRGFTTNPTLMRKAGLQDYEAFARQVLEHIVDLPISFEVFSDEPAEMERQARKIAAWGPNVYVKVPVTNTRQESTAPLVERLSGDGIQLNVTAVFSLRQVAEVVGALSADTPAVVSVFAGRIANTGLDPMPLMRAAVAIAAVKPRIEVLWASPREALNVVQAEECGCHIITVTADIQAALKNLGKDLEQYSLETVKMFRDDAEKAGFRL